MSRTTGFPPSYRITEAGGAGKLGLAATIKSVRPIPITRTLDNTFANSTAVYANATPFKAALLAIEQQIAALGG